MRNIIVLIKKDIWFNLLIYLGIYIVTVVLLIAAALGLDGSSATDTLNYLVYTCCVSIIVVPFSYNIEDDFSTRKFVAALPVSMKQILIAKLLLSIIAAIGLSFTALVVFNSFGKSILYRCALIPTMLSMMMSSLFMMVFYKWDMNVARLVAVAPIILFAFSAKMLERMDLEGDLFSLNFLLITLVIVSGFTLLLQWVSLKFVENRGIV